MSDQLQVMIDRAKRQAIDVRALATEDADRFLVRVEEDRWSPGEQVHHITLSNPPYVEVIDQSLREARIRGVMSDGPFKGGTIGNWFAKSMAPPVRRRMRTLKKLMPPPDMTSTEIVQGFERMQAELVSSMESARGVDLDRAKIRSPYLKALRMPVFSAYEVLLTHADRHLWIATQMLDS